MIFFPIHEFIDAPADFASNIVRGRTYDVAGLPETHSVPRALQLYQSSSAEDAVEQLLLTARTKGDPRLVFPRIGQQAFKAVIAENFHHHCAITGDKVRPVLEAAHVLPVDHGGQHRSDNGLLLRSDVHKLFDFGYIGVDEKYRLRVSPALREQFGNGDWFYARAGTEIDLPDRRVDRPNREFLQWHNATVFRR